MLYFGHVIFLLVKSLYIWLCLAFVVSFVERLHLVHAIWEAHLLDLKVRPHSVLGGGSFSSYPAPSPPSLSYLTIIPLSRSFSPFSWINMFAFRFCVWFRRDYKIINQPFIVLERCMVWWVCSSNDGKRSLWMFHKLHIFWDVSCNNYRNVT